MNKTRKEGIAYVKNRFGEISSKCICVSQYYSAKESWAKEPSWWHEFSAQKLKDCQAINLVCQNENGKDFYLLCVPVNFFQENLNGLDIRKDTISIWLSAGQGHKFHDLRGSGKVDFSIWLKE